jgi:hypothetical protein
VTKLIVQVATKQIRLPVPEVTSQGYDVPPDIAQLIHDCWDSDPALRPDFEDITPRLEEAIIEAPDRLPKFKFDRPRRPGSVEGKAAPLLAQDDGGPTLLYSK